MPDDLVIRLLVVLLLVLANGFFVASEFALVAVRRSRVDQLVAEGRPGAVAMQRALQHLNANLAAAQLGITMASLALGWIGEPALAHFFEPAFHFLPGDWPLVSAHALASILAFALITVLHIVVGEQAPKVMALQRSEQTAIAIALPMEVIRWVFGPAIALLNGASGLVLRLFGLQPATEEERVHSVEELKYLVTASRHAGVLDEIEGEMVDRVFDFGETRTYEVMLPRTQMVAVEADSPLDAALDVMAAEGHTRLPVYEGNLDNVVGIVHVHDVLRAQRHGGSEALTVHRVMRPPLIVPESASVEAILGEMRRHRTQMAVVIDEHGGTAGLVTMEDLVEEIVGEVQDELEHPHDAIRPQPDGTVLVDGLVTVNEFGERFGVEVPDEDYNTVGGLVMARLGKVPRVGDVVKVDGYDLRVEAMDHLRVATVRLAKR